VCIRGGYPFDLIPTETKTAADPMAAYMLDALRCGPKVRYDLLERVWALASFVPPETSGDDKLAAAQLRAMFHKRILHRGSSGKRFFGTPDDVKKRMDAIGGGVFSRRGDD
jgi:hypothetical protein